MLIYGHRGSPATQPENTLRSIREAVNAGVHGLEFDVQRSADRVPVIIHDDDVARTTNGSGKVSELSARELKAFDAGAGESIPTLAEVLGVVDTGLHLDIEVKCAGIEPEILAVIGDRSRSSWAISSFDWPMLRAFRALAPDIELWVLAMSVSEDAVAEARDLGATTLAVHTLSLNEESVGKATEAGFRVMAWTANTVEECLRLQTLGVHAVCTDDPARIIAALA